jgi:hypothetical protein
LDVRRIWECPACGRRVKREGEITSYKCHCQDPAMWMRLIEDRRLVWEYEPYIVPEIAADDLMEDEEPAPSESVIVAEAVLVEMIGPVEIESPLPEAEDFYSPEAEAEVSPPVGEPSAPEPPEPIPPEPIPPEPITPEPPAAESAPEPVSSDSPPETTPKEQPRTGKSRRRRSGRKRHRRPGSQEGG